MQSIPDITHSNDEAKAKINAINTYVEVSKSEKKLKKSTANSLSKSIANTSTQLSKITELQKRYLRDPPNSMDNLLDLLGLTTGSGTHSLVYLRKKILEAAVKIEPSAQAIIKEQSLKAIGCAQEQTYKGKSQLSLDLQPLSLIPILGDSESIYIPVPSIDFFGNLKSSVDSTFGKVYYEKPEPSASTKFKPYGGAIPFPMNKQLNQLMTSSNLNRSIATINGKNYQGASTQNLFDIQYTNVNSLGITGDFFRVMMIDRVDSNGNASNKVGEFLKDYYSTIKLVDSVDFGAQIVNIISNAINIQSQIGGNTAENQTKFEIIVQRILGLCFDSRREIDVSGISKVAELDGVDDSFFEFTEVDLRNIEINVANIQNGVMEFEDCGNVKLPVNHEVLVNELIKFRDTQSGQTNEQRVATLEQIIDTISQNPQWGPLIPNNFNVSGAINKNVIKQIPLAVAAAILSPKTLLPIFAVLGKTQSSAINSYNQYATSGNSGVVSANTIINSGATIGQQVNNVISTSVDFIQKFKTFCVQVISKINAEFLKVLFDLLKKDIINLISVVLSDVENSKKLKKYTIILKLVQIALVVAQLIDDYRKCKSLILEILLLLNLINNVNSKKPLIGSKNEIPLPLLLLSKLLPGTSPERSTINTIQGLQSLGIPTGVLPDGSPNLMLLYNLATHRGASKENDENGKVEVIINPDRITGTGKFL
jgi:hypothetical protein